MIVITIMFNMVDINIKIISIDINLMNSIITNMIAIVMIIKVKQPLDHITIRTRSPKAHTNKKRASGLQATGETETARPDSICKAKDLQQPIDHITNRKKITRRNKHRPMTQATGVPQAMAK